MNGTDLLTEFRESGSETAFGELVRRFTNLVYSAAHRRLASDALAQEVTQTVFIRLARIAPKLPSDAALAAWLHRTTLHVSIDLWRSESRRSAREEQAVTMQPAANEPALWNEITPVVDESLNQLNDLDRQTLLLRFFEQKSMRDLGAAFGVSEDAAKMRVGRALERLRRQLTSRGVTCSALVLGTLLAQRSVEAVPAKLVAVLGSIAWPAPATGLAGFLLRASIPKLATVTAGLVLSVVAVFMLLRTEHSARNAAAGASVATPNAVAPATDPGATPADADLASNPDPIKLLQGVARARNRFASGSMTLEIFADRFETGHKETNYVRSKIVFDGTKKRFDSVGREYRYTRLLPDSREDEKKIKEQNLDRDGAILAGLLTPFEAHTVNTYNGDAFLEYRETDGRPQGATISGPDQGGANYLFDPRCLGLRSRLSRETTVEQCLGYEGEATVKFIGLESVDDVAAWHITVRTAHAETLEYWIDAAHPIRVLRHVKGSDMANSKYNDADPGNPIPIEVTTREYHQGTLFATRRYIRSEAEFNTPVDPVLWTLAGLDMKPGTSVTDVRISRGLGYWTGAGLGNSVPRQEPHNNKTNSPTPPDRAAQLALLENDPGSVEALGAAKWILFNTPDGPDVEKAAEVVLEHHIASPEMTNAAPQLERMRHRSSRKLLEAMLGQNPDPEIRAAACFSLATLLKDQAEYGKNKEVTRDAEKYFEQVITEFAGTGPKGADYARRSKPELNEIRHLFIGHPAPALEGDVLDGNRLKLSDYRGKVVVLFFWYDGVAGYAADDSKLLESLGDRPFTVIGVDCDRDAAKARAAVERYQWNWPSIYDGDQGPISRAWNVHSWLSTLVIDAKGVIRFRGVRGDDLVEAVDTLLRE